MPARCRRAGRPSPWSGTAGWRRPARRRRSGRGDGAGAAVVSAPAAVYCCCCQSSRNAWAAGSAEGSEPKPVARPMTSTPTATMASAASATVLPAGSRARTCDRAWRPSRRRVTGHAGPSRAGPRATAAGTVRVTGGRPATGQDGGVPRPCAAGGAGNARTGDGLRQARTGTRDPGGTGSAAGPGRRRAGGAGGGPGRRGRALAAPVARAMRAGLLAGRARRGLAAWRGRRARSQEGTRSACPSPSPFQRPVDFPGRIAFGQVLALIVGPLATARPSSTLTFPSLKYSESGTSVRPCSAILLARRSISLRCSRSFLIRLRGVVGPGALDVLGDVDVVQPHLVAGDLREPVRQGRAARAQRLHLGAGQDQPRLEVSSMW